jgi:hypothetical protein
MHASKANISKQATNEQRRIARAKRLLKTLAFHYARGKKLNSKKRSPANSADKYDFSESVVAKQKEFYKKYTEAEFDRLSNLRRPNGLPLHWGHVQVLLTCSCERAADKKTRAKLQTDAAAKGWSKAELYEEIKTRFPGNRRLTPDGIHGVGGRKRKCEPGSREFLESLLEHGKALRSKIELLDQHMKGQSPTRRKRKRDWSSLKKSIRGVLKAIEKELSR